MPLSKVSSGCLGSCGCHRDVVEVMSQDAPADPSFHPDCAMKEAPRELVPALQHTDPPFNPRPPAPPAPEPALLLIRFVVLPSIARTVAGPPV